MIDLRKQIGQSSKGAIFGGAPAPFPYRYVLWRAASMVGHGLCVFVMLNPSTADGTANDPTIRRCIAFATRLGHARLIVVNLFAARATDPKDLKTLDDPVGPQNTDYIKQVLSMLIEEKHGTLIYGWGHNFADDPATEELRCGMFIATGAHGITPMCFGKTKDGQPRHPLMLRADEKLVAFDSL